MSVTVGVLSTLALSVSFAFATSALALDLKGTGKVTPPAQNKVQRLTERECQGLGGKVVVDWQPKCEAKCVTVDGAGVVRSQCIDEVKH